MGLALPGLAPTRRPAARALPGRDGQKRFLGGHYERPPAEPGTGTESRTSPTTDSWRMPRMRAEAVSRTRWAITGTAISLHVVRDHVVAALQHGHRLGALHQVDRRPGATRPGSRHRARGYRWTNRRCTA